MLCAVRAFGCLPIRRARLGGIAWCALLLCTQACTLRPGPPVTIGPARGAPQLELIAPSVSIQQRRHAVLAHARRLLAKPRRGSYQAEGFAFSKDPIGFVRAAFWGARLELLDPQLSKNVSKPGMAVLFRSVARRGRLHKAHPRPGDLVFFDPSEKQQQLYPTQVAVVERVGDDGTIQVLGDFAGGPARIALNLRHPTSSEHNATLRGQRHASTAAQLFRTFADPFR